LCQKCPENKISVKGSTSIDDCICDFNFYKNPENSKECFTCPFGATCSETNLTVPTANPGYWFSNENVNAFYLCYPKEACPGGNALNCCLFLFY
jgi:hypothetical protein